jgi:energy-coupling factor transporter transmembrane protein EcfT
MPARQQQPTLADYVAVAICPALIIALVVSLVFFLLEVLYVGRYAGRLQWIFFFFVLGAVLIARMSMSDVADRAGLYGIVLAVVMAIALHVLVEYPEGSPLAGFRWLVNLGLMALIWWSAHQLTRDCTFVDESADASGAGLLEAAGFEAPDEDRDEKSSDVAVVDERPARRRKKAKSALDAWWARYQRYREARRKKPHAPGVWIIYFSLAALPLFGLGQSLIPPEEVERRQYVFWLMAAYVGSGLGLLLTTSFLGLRRYLRQRRLTMPVSMTSIWLTIGGVMIGVLLVLGALLPRPNPEYPLIELSSLGRTGEQQASRFAMSGGKAAKGQGRGAADESVKDQQGGKSSSGSQGDKQQGGSKESQSSQGSGQGEPKSNQGQPQGSDKSNDQSSQKSDGNQDRNQSGEKSGERSNQDDSNGGKRADADKKDKQDESKGERSKQNSGGSSAPKFSPPSFLSLFSGLGEVLKWSVFAVVALVVGFVVLRAVLKFLANFTGWAKRWLAALQGLWQALFAWWLPSAGPKKSGAEPERELVIRPFSSYRNPFWDGAGNQGSPEELVQYSFEALQAWAREHAIPRETGETPLEFSSRLGQDFPALDSEVRRLAALYARAAYARARLPLSSIDIVRQFWQRLQEADQAPLSAGERD